MAIARDDLGRDGFDGEAELFRDMFFDARVDIGEGADRARNGAGRDFGAGGDQARLAAGKFGIGFGHFEAEGDGFGVDTVAAADGRGQLMLEGAALDDGQQLVDILDQQVRRAGELDREAGVEHVARRHSLMHEAGFVAHLFGDPGEEGDDVMLGDSFDRVDRGDVDHRVGGPPVPQGLGRRGRYDAQFAQLFRRMRLDLEPDLEAGFRLPEGGHCGAGIARDHERILQLEEIRCRAA